MTTPHSISLKFCFIPETPEFEMKSLTLLDLLGKEMQLILQDYMLKWENLTISDRIGQGTN